MFAPTNTWRRWHRKISKGQRRFATCSAIAATSLPSLVMARGHRIEQVPEIPLVVADKDIGDVAKTKDAVALLRELGAYDDVMKVKKSHHIRKGHGKARNRRHVQRKGPLVIHANSNSSLVMAFRNIPGVDLCHVERLNLLQLAPGGHLGRFVIWTEQAFGKLDEVFGTNVADSCCKSGFRPPRSIMTNADITRIINSDAVQSAVQPRQTGSKRAHAKRNPLKNRAAMLELNPHADSTRRRALQAESRSKEQRDAIVASKRQRTRNANATNKRDAFNITLHTPSTAPERGLNEQPPKY